VSEKFVEESSPERPYPSSRPLAKPPSIVSRARLVCDRSGQDPATSLLRSRPIQRISHSRHEGRRTHWRRSVRQRARAMSLHRVAPCQPLRSHEDTIASAIRPAGARVGVRFAKQKRACIRPPEKDSNWRVGSIDPSGCVLQAGDLIEPSSMPRSLSSRRRPARRRGPAAPRTSAGTSRPAYGPRRPRACRRRDWPVQVLREPARA
jgi:hypothetical protein